jgi:hypothetical protein
MQQVADFQNVICCDNLTFDVHVIIIIRGLKKDIIKQGKTEISTKTNSLQNYFNITCRFWH